MRFVAYNSQLSGMNENRYNTSAFTFISFYVRNSNNNNYNNKDDDRAKHVFEERQ